MPRSFTRRLLISLAATLPSMGLAHPVADPAAIVGEGLQMDFPAEKQDRRTLPNGVEFLSVVGTITNTSSEEKRVPNVLIALRDASERLVYAWCVTPQKRRLSSGDTIEIAEAVTDVPKSAQFVEFGWATQSNADWCMRQG